MAIGDTTKVEPFDPSAALAEAESATGTNPGNLFQHLRQSQESFASRHDLERKALSRMAALKRFSPLILGVIHRPGIHGASSNKAEALRNMMDASFSLARDMVDKITNGQRSDFIQDQALSAISEIVATEWAFNGSTEVREHVMAVLDHMADMGDVVEDIAHSHWQPGGNLLREELSAGLTMSLLKASEPILTLLKDFGVDSAENFEALQDMLVEDAMEYLGRISRELPSSTRLMMTQNHLGVSARIMKVSLTNALNQQQPATAAALDLQPAVNDWKLSLAMLDKAVEAKVSVALSEEGGLLKPSPSKSAEMTP